MAIQALQVTARRQTLTIQYENPFGECIAEYALDEYTATASAKNGREAFLCIKPAQWRSVCRDIVTAKRVNPKQVLRCIAWYASAAAAEIFLNEFEKDACRRLAREYKRANRPADEAREEARRRTQQLARQIEGYRPETLDEFAAHFTVNLCTLDEFAENVAA